MLRRLMFVCTLLLALTSFAWADIPLSQGHKVEIVFEKVVSSGEAVVGDTVPIKTHTAIEYGGYTVVEAGSNGRAVITAVTPASKPGKAGRVEVRLLEIELSNPNFQTKEGEEIMLEAVEAISAEGKNKKTKSWILGFGLIIKGTEGIIPANTPFKAVIAKDIDILTD